MIVTFGDSLTAGYGLPHEDGFQAQLQAALRRQGHDVQILDGAVSGDTTAGGRARLDWALADNPEFVNDSPYDQGWMLRVRPDDAAEYEALMDAAAYRELIGG